MAAHFGCLHSSCDSCDRDRIWNGSLAAPNGVKLTSVEQLVARSAHNTESAVQVRSQTRTLSRLAQRACPIFGEMTIS